MSDNAYDWAGRVLDSSALPSEVVRLLVYGEAGSGKTNLMGTFPGLFVIDTDRGLRTLKDKSVKYIPLESGGDTWKEMQNLLISIRDKKPPFDKFAIKTLGLDSMSNLAEFLLADAMKRPPAGYKLVPTARTQGKPEWDHYDLVATRLTTIVRATQDLGINIVATAGVKLERDEKVGTFVGSPDIVGSYRNRIGRDFDEYFYLEPEMADGKMQYYAHTAKYKYYPAKSRDGRKPRLLLTDRGYEDLYKKT